MITRTRIRITDNVLATKKIKVVRLVMPKNGDKDEDSEENKEDEDDDGEH